jgi:hypothetical protein
MDSSNAAEAIFAPFLCMQGGMFCLIPFFWIFGMLVAVCGTALWVWMLIDAAKRDEKQFPGEGSDQRLIWILIIVLTNWVGALIYYFLIYKKMGKAE